MTRAGFHFSIGCVLAGFALAGCAQSSLEPGSAATASIGTPTASPASSKSRGVKIAIILPFGGYGEPAQIARGMKQAAEMALFEANDPAIQLITKDDGGTPQGAMAAADAALKDGAEIILGPLFGACASAIAPIANKAGVPVVAFSNDPAVAGHGVYLMSYLASDEVNRIVAYAAQTGKRRFAALIPDTAYGKTVEPAFRAAVAKAGGEVTSLERYPNDGSGMLTSANRVFQSIKDAEAANEPIDALFVPAGKDHLAQLGSLLAYSGIGSGRLKLLGTSAWDIPMIDRGDQLIGGWFAASDPAGWTAFTDKYSKSFGTVPPRLATLAYDAMSMAITLSAGPQPGRYSVANLTRPQGFTGVDGPIRLTEAGLTQRSLAVLEIEKYRSVGIDPAMPTAANEKVSIASTRPRS